LCLQAGASHFDVIDSTAAIEIARQSLTQAGRGEQANSINGLSFQVELPDPANVVICDDGGDFGFDSCLGETQASPRCPASPTLAERVVRLEGGRVAGCPVTPGLC